MVKRLGGCVYASMDSWGHGEDIQAQRRGSGSPVAGKGFPAATANVDDGEVHGSLRGSSEVVTAWSQKCAWV